MTINHRVVARLLVGTACCWSIARLAAAQSISPTTTVVQHSESTAAGSGAGGPHASASELREITVTSSFLEAGGRSALKMPVPVRDVPFTLQDYSQSFMKAVDSTRLTDMYGYMSGVQRAGPTTYDLNIRGFSSTVKDPNSVLVDGLPGQPARTASPETANIERIEVVKGPASVLYGQNEPGGFIDLITKKPQAMPATTVELRANTWDGAGVSFGRKNGYTGIIDTTGALDARDRFLGRAIVEYTNAQSFRQFVLDKDLMIAPSLTWSPSDRTKATLLLEYRRGRDSYDSGLVVPDLNSKLIAPIVTRYQNPEDMELEVGETATLLLHHAFSDSLSWNLNARSVYNEDHEIGFDNSSIKGFILTRMDRDQDNDHHYNAIDTSVTDLFHTGAVRHRLLAGAMVSEVIQDYNQIRHFPTAQLQVSVYDPVSGWAEVAPPAGSEPPQAHTWGSTKAYGLYATDLMTFTRHWKGVVGVRYENAHQLNKELRLPDMPNQTRLFTDAFPMGGLIYQPTRQWSLYASYSTSFIPPPPGAQSYIPGERIDAQTATQKEVGAKFESESGHASATLSLFDIREKNLIQLVGHTGLYEEVGAARSRGVEVQVNLQPTSWWQLNANYALTDAQITGSVIASQIGARSLNAPRSSASLLSRLQFPGRFENFGWMIGVIYRSQRAGTLPSATELDSFMMPGYSTIDTGIYYSGNNYDVSLKISNALDRQYLQSALNTVYITPGDPRNLSLTFRKFIQ